MRGHPAPPWSRRRGWRVVGRLQTRLFLWFLVAIAASYGANSLTSWWNRREEPPPNAMNVATRTIAARVAKQWDDPAACEAYLTSVRDLTGFQLRIRRDRPPMAPRPGSRSGIAFEGNGEALIPVVRDGQTVGALEFDASRPPSRRPPWTFFGLVAGFVVLGVAARGVARRLAWPLEDVAGAAERFGSGDLAARTHVGQARHFVAEEVREVATAFDQMADRIARVVRDQRELLAAISHELRSPLGRARVALEIARDRESAAGTAAAPPTAASSLDEIERQLADVDAILGDLLAAARAGLSDVKREPTPVLAWLRARLASEPQSPPIELAVDEATLPRDVALSIDAPLMNRALHNVVSNARSHGEGPIEVRVTADDARVVILVRDRGPGFTPDVLARAFDPFVKGDAARTPGSGYGLGLALVRRIAEAHGGRAFAGNVDGGGAEVGIELPRTTAEMV